MDASSCPGSSRAAAVRARGAPGAVSRPWPGILLMFWVPPPPPLARKVERVLEALTAVSRVAPRAPRAPGGSSLRPTYRSAPRGILRLGSALLQAKAGLSAAAPRRPVVGKGLVNCSLNYKILPAIKRAPDTSEPVSAKRSGGWVVAGVAGLTPSIPDGGAGPKSQSPLGFESFATGTTRCQNKLAGGCC